MDAISSTFISDALRLGSRLDSRSTTDFRPIRLRTIGPETGCIEACLGRTRILATVTASPHEPYSDRPAEGILSIVVDAGSESSSVEVDVLTRALERGVKKSRAIDLEALCIVAARLVWNIRVDVHIHDDDGNLLDCATIAVITALLHFRRPDVTVSGEDVTIHPVEKRNPVPLSIHHLPLSISFAFLDDNTFIVDPTKEESMVTNGGMTLTMNSQRELCALTKADGLPLTMDQVNYCSDIAYARVMDITETIQSFIKESHKQ